MVTRKLSITALTPITSNNNLASASSPLSLTNSNLSRRSSTTYFSRYSSYSSKNQPIDEITKLIQKIRNKEGDVSFYKDNIYSISIQEHTKTAKEIIGAINNIQLTNSDKISYLQKLDLSNNNLNENDLFNLKQAVIQKKINLQSLNLSFNDISINDILFFKANVNKFIYKTSQSESLQERLINKLVNIFPKVIDTANIIQLEPITSKITQINLPLINDKSQKNKILALFESNIKNYNLLDSDIILPTDLSFLKTIYELAFQGLLPCLTTITIHNNFTLEDLENLTKAIKFHYLPNLQVIDLGRQHCTKNLNIPEHKWVELFNVLSNTRTPNLKELYLNGLDRSCYSVLTLKKLRLQNLEQLDLSDNPQIKNLSIQYLLGNINNVYFPQLKVLNLHNLNINDELASDMYFAIERNIHNFTYIDIQGTQINDSILQQIVQDINDINLGKKHALSIVNCENADLISLYLNLAIKALNNNLPLNYLDLSNSLLDNTMLGNLFLAIQDNSHNLINITMNNTQVNSQDMFELIDIINLINTSLKNSSKIDFSNDDMPATDISVIEIAKAIQQDKLSDLQELNLQSTFTSNKGASALFKAIATGKATHLQKIDLSFTHIYNIDRQTKEEDNKLIEAILSALDSGNLINLADIKLAKNLSIKFNQNHVEAIHRIKGEGKIPSLQRIFLNNTSTQDIIQQQIATILNNPQQVAQGSGKGKV